MNSNNTIPAVEKTILLLEYLAENDKPATQAQLKKALGISMSTAYRILRTLLASGWAVKNEDSTYSLGSAAMAFAATQYSDKSFFDGFQTVLDSTAHACETGCKLSIRKGSEQMTLLRAEPDSPVVLTGKVNSRFPVIEGSVGAALLFREREETLGMLIESCRSDIPEKHDKGLLFKNISAVVKDGFCLNSNTRWNISAMSAPVCDKAGNVFAALTIVMPQAELTLEQKKTFSGILLKKAAECETLYNHRNNKS